MCKKNTKMERKWKQKKWVFILNFILWHFIARKILRTEKMKKNYASLYNFVGIKAHFLRYEVFSYSVRWV